MGRKQKYAGETHRTSVTMQKSWYDIVADHAKKKGTSVSDLIAKMFELYAEQLKKAKKKAVAPDDSKISQYVLAELAKL